jgi:hypothetical protein
VRAYVDRQLVPASLANWTVSGVSGQVVNMAVPVTGFVLVSRRPENRIGWLFLVAGLALGLSSFWNGYALHTLIADPGSLPLGIVFAWLSNWVWAIAAAMLSFLFLLCPTGQLRSQRWRPAAWFAGVAFAVSAICLLIAASSEWAQLAGLRLRDRWAGWNREPFTTDSRSHVSVWQKRQSNIDGLTGRPGGT